MTRGAPVRAILWAQWRSVWNLYPRASKGGILFTAAGALAWYGVWVLAALGAAALFATTANRGLATSLLQAGLFLAALYWQVTPILLVNSGVSLDVRRLLAYPIPENRLYGLEVLLRLSVSMEVVTVLLGAAVGLALNPAVPARGLAGLLLFGLFNLFLSAGLRDLLGRLLARRRIREVVIFLLVLLAALPQLLLLNGVPPPLNRLARASGPGLAPWSAAADVAMGSRRASQWIALAGWAAAAWAFGRWQFARSLRFDERAAAAAPAGGRPGRWTPAALLRWPAAVLPDPLAALVEKELCLLARAPRFRLVFLMGFSFGLLIWLPLAFGPDYGLGHAVAANYLTFVSVYALLLLGEVSFYNMFGFDRASAQVYYVLPVPLSTVIRAKNLTALLAVLAEVTLVAAVCALLRLPLTPARLVEAYSVTAVLSVYMLALGNLSSMHFPRAVDPSQSWRTGGAGRFQAMLLIIYPVVAAPILLAYAARWAFDSTAAFYAAMAVAALIGAIFYWVATDTALAAAESRKEQILEALSHGQGPITA